MSREAPIIQTIAKRSNNTCPMCWMPLNVGRGVEAAKWQNIQVAFKGKPSFSVKKDGNVDFSRAINVFGVNEFAGGLNCNYQKCHYVHFSHVGTQVNFNALWSLSADPEPSIRKTRCTPTDEPLKRDDFYVCLFDKGFGLFKEAFRTGSTTRAFLEELCGTFSVRLEHASVLSTELLSQYFIGCADCNYHMTNSGYIADLFDMLFPRSAFYVANTDHRRFFTKEEMIHYIMLSGCLESSDKEQNGEDFIVRDIKKHKTWTLRYILMWCALQILFCSWKIESMHRKARHHTDYLMMGIMDFYVALWFYALHRIYQRSNDHKLYFEEFHYYYTSMYPFFQKKRQGGVHVSNISALVFGVDIERGWKFDDSAKNGCEEVQRQIALIFSSMLDAWRTHIKPVSDFIYQGLHPEINTYFISPRYIITRRERIVSAAFDLTLQAFVDDQGAFWYWFHFKHITMPRITVNCNRYQALQIPPNVMPAKALWHCWSLVFEQNLRALGVRAHLERRRLEQVEFIQSGSN